jgi:hypothetical protein
MHTPHIKRARKPTSRWGAIKGVAVVIKGFWHLDKTGYMEVRRKHHAQDRL